jgi:hypothetical protein
MFYYLSLVAVAVAVATAAASRKAGNKTTIRRVQCERRWIEQFGRHYSDF